MRFGFLINEVVTGLRRNVTMTVAMILTTAISIGLFGGGLLVVRLADQSREIYLDRVESQVFLTNDVSANDPTCDADPCKALRSQIEARDDVRSVRFLNQEQAYEDAIAKFPQYKDVAGKDVAINLTVDPSILGGLIVKIGSRQIDTSLKTKLTSMKLALKEVG